MKKQLLIGGAILLVLILGLVLFFTLTDRPGDIVIYYTNDIHTYINNHPDDPNNLAYSKLATLKATTENAVLVDAGDHIQGSAYGGMDKGETIIRLMNAAGYDVATLGNHEFDYGMARCLELIGSAQHTYVSCNFYHEENGTVGDLVLEPYTIIKVGGRKIAFVGVMTPESITASTPTYFQDENGNYIYGIHSGSDGQALYAAVQTAVDAAIADGADYVIALGHLGVDPSSGSWTSRSVIANTTGIDAFIDGHSHTTIQSETVQNKAGDSVVLTQTGSYFDAVGKMTIPVEGAITTELLDMEDLASTEPSPEVKAIEDQWITEINSRLGEVIGYSEIVLDNFDSEGNRIVCKHGTNSGDFSADALYYLFLDMGIDVDVAVMNGGGIRNNAITGELTYMSCKKIHTFGNVACLLQVTGQQLLDALEWGSMGLTADGTEESGSLLHVSGIRYTVDLRYDSTVQYDDKEVWTGPPTGEYRVKDVQVYNRETGTYEPLDLDKIYRLAGYNYTLRDLGGGFAMFNGAENILDYVAEDYMVLAKYIQSFPVDSKTGLPTIPADGRYDDLYGSGRITLIYGP